MTFCCFRLRKLMYDACMTRKVVVEMSRILAILCVFFALVTLLECRKQPKSSGDSKFASVQYFASNESFQISSDILPNSVAWANFTDHVQKTGWSYLTVSTNDSYNDHIQAYAAGLVEGFITADFIYMAWMNTLGKYCADKTPFCLRLESFLELNINWLIEETQKNPNDPYFHQVRLLMEQLNGLQDGYHDAPGHPSMQLNDVFGFLLFQLSGDLEDLQSALKKADRKSRVGFGHCSALIKLLPGNTDMYIAHDTWTTYQDMLRIIKKYEFPFKTAENSKDKIPGHTVSFSGYPGAMFSGDDFYILSSGMVAQETTIGNSNDDLWKYVLPTGRVLEWMRNIIANRLATSAMEWTDIFKKYNSGTYNNQWMVLDYKKFTPGKPLPKSGVLAILEQIPGHVVADDLTSVLAKQTYWPSYNAPYFPSIFNMSGLPAMVSKYGDWFTYDKTPRALIFKRDHSKVTNVRTMIKLMRYNDFKNDPLSRCNCTPPYSAENSISARSDLNPADGKYPFSALQHRCHGGTDMKMTSSGMAKSFSFMAVSGPTHDEQPAFQWSKSDYKDLIHMGHPDLWAFDPVKVTWKD